MTKPQVALFLALVLLVSAPAGAALSPALREWGKGPVQWIMTKDEQRAWSAVQSDREANDFIDLFWARRDPSPGTEYNEFKEEFEGRVRTADKVYAAEKKRGSLTDMGRVFVVLGPPKQAQTADGPHLGVAAGGNDADVAMGSDSGVVPFGGALQSRLTARTTFTYESWISLGLAKPIVIFIEDAYSHDFKIDPQQSNAYGAMAG